MTEAPSVPSGPEALFLPEGDTLRPTALTVGPWSPHAQHGGPVAAVLTRAAEAAPAAAPMQVLRMTVELLRPAPVEPMTVSTRVWRDGRNVQLVDVSLSCSGIEIARARALRLRALEVAVPTLEPDPPSPPLPEGPAPVGTMPRTGFLGAVDLRFVDGSWTDVGPARLWGRLLVPVVAGEEPSGLQQLVAIADFGNGVSRVVDFDTHTFINPDLTVAISRAPHGGWIGLDARTRLADDGYGQAESLVFDVDGPVGRAVQTLLVTAR